MMSKPATYRSVTTAVAALALVCVFAASAFAGSAASGILYYGSSEYKTYSKVVTIPGMGQAEIYNSRVNTPALSGYLGNQARLLGYKGALACASSWQYNSSTIGAASYFAQGLCTYSSTGTWYARGKARGWDPGTSSYIEVFTLSTPSHSS